MCFEGNVWQWDVLAGRTDLYQMQQCATFTTELRSKVTRLATCTEKNAEQEWHSSRTPTNSRRQEQLDIDD